VTIVVRVRPEGWKGPGNGRAGGITQWTVAGCEEWTVKIAMVQSIRNLTLSPNGQLQYSLLQAKGRYAMTFGAIGYGMLHVATVLAAKHDVSVYSLPGAVLSNDMSAALQGILGSDVVGIQLNWGLETVGALAFAEYVKKHSMAKIVIGGTHASLFADTIARYPAVDYVIRGEAEQAMTALVHDIEEGRLDSSVPGVVSKTRDNGIGVFCGDIDELPPYDLSLVKTPLQLSVPFAVNRVRGTCNIACPYCLGGFISRINGRKKLAFHSPAWIARQVAMLQEFSPGNIAFQDEAWLSLCHDRSYLTEVADELVREGSVNDVPFGIVDNAPPIYSEEVLESLARANVTVIDYGCESGSDRVLHDMRRPYDVERMQQTISSTYRLGMIPGTWWMVGFPREEQADLDLTEEAIRRTTGAGGFPYWVTPVYVVPGTPLFDEPTAYGLQLFWNTFEDYAEMSRMDYEVVRTGDYARWVTHATDSLSREQIVASATRMRQVIQDSECTIVGNLAGMKSRFLELHPKFPAEQYDRFSGSVSRIWDSLF